MFFFLIPLVLSAMSFAAAAGLQSLPFAFLGGVFGLVAALFIVLAELAYRAQQIENARWNQLAKEARRHV